MKTVEIKIYKFNELNALAKSKAIDNFRISEDYQYILDESVDTLKKFCEIFNIRWNNFDPCEMYRSEWSFSRIEDYHLELSGLRLQKYIWNNFKNDIFQGKYYGKLVDTFKDGSKIEVSKKHPVGKRHVKRYSKLFLSKNCPFTGVCWDYSILDPIYNFLEARNPLHDFETLLNDCLYSLGKEVCDEIDARQSDEYIIENIEINDYGFTYDGDLF